MECEEVSKLGVVSDLNFLSIYLHFYFSGNVVTHALLLVELQR